MSALPKPIKKETAKEIVVFQNRKRVKPDSEQAPKKFFKKPKKEAGSDDEDKPERMSLKQAKFDVFKFGIKGFSKEEQENAKMQLAIKLGAAPPKNKCVNYKEIINSKKEEKLKKEELVKENRLFEAKVLSSKSSKLAGNNKKKTSMSSQRKAKISKGHVGNIKGHIGSFSNGILKINKHDLKKINS